MLPLTKGILTALIMTVGVGPGMLINFHTSMRRGFIAGLFVVAGLYLSDLTFIAINYFGVLFLIKYLQNQRAVAIICGIMLCIFGIAMLLNKPRAIVVSKKIKHVHSFRDLLKNFLSGFIVNISNPFVFIFWMTLMSIASLNFGFRTQSFHIYFAAVILSALCLDITKSYFFSRFRSGIKENFMKMINLGTGTVLAFCGVAIICRSIFIIHQPLFP
jgi:threonine/homoserine/homoserine lactone efflux protein